MLINRLIYDKLWKIKQNLDEHFNLAVQCSSTFFQFYSPQPENLITPKYRDPTEATWREREREGGGGGGGGVGGWQTNKF